jgi:large subunit ribosomal protein L13
VKTYMPKASEVKRAWYVVDAAGQTLGRLASRVARVLMGKHKPTYTPHMDMGDHVIIINAAKVKVTGKKLRDKLYIWHTGYPGGLRQRSLEQMMQRNPAEVIAMAVEGMLPKTRLGRAMARKLKVYPGPDHPHQAQKPQPIDLSDRV